MRIIPVLFDHQPRYMRGASARASLLLTPLGGHSLIDRFRMRLPSLHGSALTVAPTFATGAAYKDAFDVTSEVASIVPATHIDELLGSCAPDDWLLFADPLCFPLEPVLEGQLVARLPRSRAVTHLVAVNRAPDGVSERVRVNRRGAVRGVRRHYDARTWRQISGVMCTLLPASIFSDVADIFGDCASLTDLRTTLAGMGIPSRDLPLSIDTLNLSHEANLLRLTQQALLELTSAERGSRGALVDRTAHLHGPVTMHADVVVGGDATIVGPTVLARGCRIGSGAVVAQCVIGPGVTVPEHTVLRHRAIFSDDSLEEACDWNEPEYDEATALGSLLDTTPPAQKAWYPIVKNIIDRTVALAATVVLAPFLALVALLIKLDSRGPIFYGEVRETIGGRLFTCWKFRTMQPDAAAQQAALADRNQMDGPQFKINGDPRLTRLGRWLRKVSIDELPQLFNVIAGDMSLVGPRPSPFRENQICVPWRQARLSVRAGITGLWQVCRDERTHGDFHQWIEYDTMYVRHMSPLVDLRIVLATFWTFGGAGRVPYTWIVRKGDAFTTPATTPDAVQARVSA